MHYSRRAAGTLQILSMEMAVTMGRILKCTRSFQLSQLVCTCPVRGSPVVYKCHGCRRSGTCYLRTLIDKPCCLTLYNERRQFLEGNCSTEWGSQCRLVPLEVRLAPVSALVSLFVVQSVSRGWRIHGARWSGIQASMDLPAAGPLEHLQTQRVPTGRNNVPRRLANTATRRE